MNCPVSTTLILPIVQRGVQMKDIITKYTLPILIAKENADDELEPVFEGSGVLFTHNGIHYIISASHVFDNIDKELGFFIPSGNEMININGVLKYNHNSDVAVLQINNPDLHKFSNYEFITRDMIAFPDPKTLGEVFLLGFPFERSHFVPKNALLKYTVLYGNLELHKKSMKEKTANAHDKIYIKYPENWDQKNLPHPKGMSGSGVWIKNRDGIKLIAINTFFNGTDEIEAIRIHIFMKVIESISKIDLFIPRMI